jgi:hypothetical protein
VSEPAWKAVQRRVARAWGFETGAYRGEPGSDGRGDGPVSLEVTRTTRAAETWRKKWRQCQRNAKTDGLPPVLVIAEPRQRMGEMTVVCKHGWLLDVCERAGEIEKKAA